MTLINQTKKTTIAENLVIPASFIDQSLGLLKYKNPTAMLFKTRFGIHMFGMKYPIDVLILNKKNNVVIMKQNLQSNRIFLWNPVFNTVLELPAGTIEKSKTEMGDLLSFEK